MQLRMTTPFSNILKYNKTQYFIIFSIIFGYATFYILRLNFTIAIPLLNQSYNINKIQIGFILSFFSIIYGLGKFVFGYICDHSNPKWFFIIGLLGASTINALIPLTEYSGYILLSLLWALNGCFQAMGWPPCARILTHNFDQKEIGTIWGLCNSAHAIGSAIIAISGSYLIIKLGVDSIFIIPSFTAALMSLILVFLLKDLPSSSPLYIEKKKNKNIKFLEIIRLQKNLLRANILLNNVIWCLCFSNFFIYIIRIGLVSWIPLYLTEYHKIPLEFAGLQLAGFEFLGIIGGIVAGYFSDCVGTRFRALIAIIFLMGLSICLLGCYYLPVTQSFLLVASLVCAGFFIYGPQILTGVIATDYVSKNVAATATGLIGTSGYIGASLSGIGIGWIIDEFGWGGIFIVFLISSFVSMFFFSIAVKINIPLVNYKMTEL